MAYYSITTSADAFPLGADRSGEAVFTVSNSNGQPARGKAIPRPEGQAKESWLKVVGDSEWAFDDAGGSAAPGTRQVRVKVTAPKETEPGKYSFRLVVVNPLSPDEEFTEGPAVGFEVKPVPPPPRCGLRCVLLIAAAAVVLLAVGAFLLLRPHNATVPQVVGHTRDEAEKAIKAAGFEAVIDEQVKAEKPVGTVLSCTPAEGTSQKRGSKVTAGVDVGVRVRQFKNGSLSEAIPLLDKDHVAYEVVKVFEPGKPAGEVVDQTPKVSEDTMRFDTKMQLKVQSPAKVPGVKGLPQAEAEGLVKGATLSFRTMVKIVPGDTGIGVVDQQSVDKDKEVAEGTTVELTVQAPYSEVPGVEGEPLVEAIKLLNTAHLTVGDVIQRPPQTPLHEAALEAQTLQRLKTRNDASLQAQTKYEAARPQMDAKVKARDSAQAFLEAFRGPPAELARRKRAADDSSAELDTFGKQYFNLAKELSNARSSEADARKQFDDATAAADKARLKVTTYAVDPPVVGRRVTVNARVSLIIPPQRASLNIKVLRDLIPPDRLGDVNSIDPTLLARPVK